MGPGDPLSEDRGQTPEGVGRGADLLAARPTHKRGTARVLSQGRAPPLWVLIDGLGLGLGFGLCSSAKF